MGGIKEELEGIITELRNDVDDKGAKIAEDRKAQEEGFERLQNEIKEIREEFKVEGWRRWGRIYCVPVRETKESAMEAQKELREDILGKLDDTNKNIEEVTQLNFNTNAKTVENCNKEHSVTNKWKFD